jgi:hypothetical protein
MPDLLSIGLGGGSLVADDGTAWARAASATGWWRRAGCSAAPPSPPRCRGRRRPDRPR